MIEQLLRRAEDIAVEAGQWVVENKKNYNKVEYKKNHLDVVTAIDVLTEKKIIAAIRENFPTHQIISEESQSSVERFSLMDADDYSWIIDPIDGTVNFIHDIPHFAVSIGIVKNGEPIAGVVYGPQQGELFSAAQGKGAYLNGKKLSVSRRTMKESLVNTGYASKDWTTDSPLQYELKKIYAKCRNIKISGSASLDLAYVASGRVDGFWQRNLYPWDLAAGSLLVSEAGGRLSNVVGETFDMKKGHILATNGVIHDELVTMLREENNR
ncbi:inositol monophosphatase [Bacillaceae bacterium SIJ1]|uniref:inositol monophosphatase family protein n=1 Tax=Litoribacterium kuwaitense TaxID=1398745 RepID=UPI0013EA4853|nr:inositol monophosphatase family protein [Litoribacterium kuwaitense]NGP45537.1 inositol monophosphatase [Litoribacterium kuwaitense]